MLSLADGEPFPEVVDECHIPECPLFNVVASQNVLSKMFQVTPSDIFLHGCIFVNPYALECEQTLGLSTVLFLGKVNIMHQHVLDI